MRFLGGVLVCALSIILTRTLSSQDVDSILTKTLFEQMLKHRNDDVCPSKGFYTYEAFIEAAKSFTAFGTTGDIHTRKREIAAFFAQTSFLTWYRSADLSPPDGEYAWGYCLNMIENNDKPDDYCVQSRRWPCVPGQHYFARGPILLTYNYNYGPAGKAIGVDLLANPNLVANNSVISFKTALWFWMTPQLAKPSSHDAMTGGWTPSVADNAAGRVAGYGLVTNIFDGEIECGLGKEYIPDYKIKFYKRYCDILGVAYGNNLDCATQKPFKRSNHS